jgi:hypothetical protein
LVENKGHAALVGWDGSAVVVALRGSLSAQDWIDDAKNAVLTDYPECEGCRVGLGWYDTCKDMAELTIAAAREVAANHPGAPLIITGHSLGAAVAPLFYAEVAKTELKEQVQFPVYTFGQPRVGNDVYAKWFEGQIEDAGEWYRVVHNNDPVPHLPPPALGFTHMSTEIYYMESGTGPGFYQVCDGSGEDQQCSAGTLVSGNFNDHNEYERVSERSERKEGAAASSEGCSPLPRTRSSVCARAPPSYSTFPSLRSCRYIDHDIHQCHAF